MITENDFWIGVDELAKKEGLSLSALALKAGLDSTYLNPSKRITKEGKSRWPSTSSLAKILNCTVTSFTEFVQLIEQ